MQSLLSSSSTLYGLGVEQRRYTDVVLELCRGGTNVDNAAVVHRIPAHRIILATCRFFESIFCFAERTIENDRVDDERSVPTATSVPVVYRLDIDPSRITNGYINEQSVENFIRILYTTNSSFSALFSFESTEEGREDFYGRAEQTIGTRALDFIAIRECADYFGNTVVAKLIDSLVTRTDWDAANCSELSRHYVGRNMLLAIYYRYRCFCYMRIQKKFDFWLFETAREFLLANYTAITHLTFEELLFRLSARCITHLLVDPDDAKNQPSYTDVTTTPIELKVLGNEDHGEILGVEMAVWNIAAASSSVQTDGDGDDDDDETTVEPPASLTAAAASSSSVSGQKRPREDVVDTSVDTQPLLVRCFQAENMKAFVYTLEGPSLASEIEERRQSPDFLTELKRRRPLQPVSYASTAPEHLRATTTLCFVAESIFETTSFSRRLVLNNAVDVIVGGSLTRSRGLPSSYNFRICLEYVFDSRNRARTKPAWRRIEANDRRTQTVVFQPPPPEDEPSASLGALNMNMLLRPLIQHESELRAANEHDDDDEQTDYRIEAVLSSRDQPTVFSYCCRERSNGRTSTSSSSSAFNIFVCNGTNVKYGRMHMYDVCIGKLRTHHEASSTTRLVVSLTLPRIFSRDVR